MPAGYYIRTKPFKRIPVEERFWSKVLKYPDPMDRVVEFPRDCNLSPEEKGCWVWTAKLCLGYGRIHINTSVGKGVYVGAHRMGFMLLGGIIPENYEIDHLCRNRACVRKDHLEAVTCGENILRGDSLQGINKRKTHCVRGHEFTPKNTRKRHRPGGGRVCRLCALLNSKKARDRKKLSALGPGPTPAE